MMISESRYKDLDSVVLENDILRVEIVPGAGARTASIIYKPAQQELLWQNPAVSHAPVRYAQPFPDGEGSGFDEMFPTINECIYQDFPWEEIKLPDHGEVWALPWSCSIDSDSVSFSVEGVRLPYRFSKRVWLEGHNFKAVYTVVNRSHFPMHFLYASHPLFNVAAGDRIIVPDKLKSITNAVPSESMPDYGSSHAWCDEFAVMPSKTISGYKKFYFTEKNTAGWSVLRREELGLEIKMSASPDKLPWLGVWMNEGGWDNQFNLALEPASASMDDLTAARRFGAESVLAPKEVREWDLDIEVNASNGRQFN